MIKYKMFLEEYNTYIDGVYISMRLTEDSENKIKDFQHKYIKDNINDDLHCTLIYSKKPFKGNIKTNNDNIVTKFKKYSVFGEDTLVLEIDSSELDARNKELTSKYDFISYFDNYSSHITLSYKCNIDISKLPDIDFDIELTKETVENLNLDYLS